MAIVLERNSVVIDEDAVMSRTTGFICRKCVRALEGFQTARAKLLQSAEAALRCMPSRPKTGGSSVLHTAESPSRRRLLSEEDYVHELVILAKRARTVSIGSSPAVQVYGRPAIIKI